MTRVLHLDSGRRMGGGQWQVFRLLQGLPAGEFDNLLLAPRNSALFEMARESGMHVQPLSLRAVASLSRNMDVVHAHDARTHTLAACPAALRLVVSRRVAFAVRRNPGSIWKYSRPTRYIAVSRHVKEKLEEAGVPEAKISVVYDGVPAAPAQARGSELICHAEKGAELARAAASLCGREIRVSTDLESDLPRARLFLYFTEAEGLGSAVLLAMAHGVPVIASRIGGLPEIVDNGRTGLLTANRSAEIAGAIRTLIEDPALASEMGRRARESVMERFSIERMARGTMEVYNAVCSSSRSH